MKLIRNLQNITNLPNCALTIGNFDGIHNGHLKIIEDVKKRAKDKNLSSAILSFYPHPIAFLRKEKRENFLINSLSQKLQSFKKANIDYAIILPFNHKFSQILAKDFIEEILIKKLNVKDLTIGYDFTFGKNREGNFKSLESYNNYFSLSEISPVKNLDKTCSSTLVRKLIKEGKIKEANQILSSNFSVSGLVNHGRKLAQNLGFPTANIKSKPHIIKPKFGVYKSIITLEKSQEKFNSITNFGIKPTINGFKEETKPIFETHIPNFNQNIYGQKITIELLDFIRDEKKFSSIEELKNKIITDIKSISL